LDAGIVKGPLVVRTTMLEKPPEPVPVNADDCTVESGNVTPVGPIDVVAIFSQASGYTGYNFYAHGIYRGVRN
jgi:hypothetical protein